jgi:hypothetical protein
VYAPVLLILIQAKYPFYRALELDQGGPAKRSPHLITIQERQITPPAWVILQ